MTLVRIVVQTCGLLLCFAGQRLVIYTQCKASVPPLRATVPGWQQAASSRMAAESGRLWGPTWACAGCVCVQGWARRRAPRASLPAGTQWVLQTDHLRGASLCWNVVVLGRLSAASPQGLPECTSLASDTCGCPRASCTGTALPCTRARSGSVAGAGKPVARPSASQQTTRRTAAGPHLVSSPSLPAPHVCTRIWGSRSAPSSGSSTAEQWAAGWALPESRPGPSELQ